MNDLYTYQIRTNKTIVWSQEKNGIFQFLIPDHERKTLFLSPKSPRVQRCFTLEMAKYRVTCNHWHPWYFHTRYGQKVFTLMRRPIRNQIDRYPEMGPKGFEWDIFHVTSIRMIGQIFWVKITETQTTWILSRYQIGQIWSHVKHVSCESFLSHLKIRPVTIPILMKDLFLNLFEP